MQLPSNPSSNAAYQLLIVEDEYVIANNLKLMLQKAGYTILGIARSVDEATKLIKQQTPDMVLLDIYLKGEATGIDLSRQLEDTTIPFIFISANDNQRVLEQVKNTDSSGYIVKPFRERDILTTLEIARYRQAHSKEMKLREEKVLQVALTDALSDNTPWADRLLRVAQLLLPNIPFEYLTLGFAQEKFRLAFCFHRVGFDEYETVSPESFWKMAGIPLEQALAAQGDVAKQGAGRYNHNDFESLCRKYRPMQALAHTYRLESALVLAFTSTRMGPVVLSFFSRQPDTYLTRHLNLLERLEQPIVLTLDRIFAYEEVARLSEKLQQENTYLQEEVKSSANFEEILGTSQPLMQVFNLVSQVAPGDTTVLLMGESGTGKELFARALHNLSARKGKIMVKVNCATLPANLIESELFGHEKGAFTGAVDRRIGKFEVAQGGTIFLDEIGELPLDLQAKLLRVLQEKEIERLGGKTPIKTDVRVIAATNRELEKEVADGRFRMDLFFRLSVFPILLPSLQERRGDIPLLATHFAKKFARRLGKPFPGFKASTVEELVSYNWPGNIRELENLMEQAVILNDGKNPVALGRSLGTHLFAARETSLSAATQLDVSATLNVDRAMAKDLPGVKQQHQESERDYILTILQKTNGRIRGAGGAAELLNIKPSTLEYRMERLGIRKTLTIKESGK
ncbi:sigma 54-interacting transcriptional regulator [Spirosoma endbachense]|uniref:Response regulator n=1 Tax=Spirosoma endbachense TaxID=2666025 RepID=A0A6P1W2U6_9BACT|nr:sigma 54-interacting transcriptional regulator [Spirosoma endbachense]QHV99375.1 response regulator [Spirosoma endbachense]